MQEVAADIADLLMQMGHLQPGLVPIPGPALLAGQQFLRVFQLRQLRSVNAMRYSLASASQVMRYALG